MIISISSVSDLNAKVDTQYKSKLESNKPLALGYSVSPSNILRKQVSSGNAALVSRCRKFGDTLGAHFREVKKLTKKSDHRLAKHVLSKIGSSRGNLEDKTVKSVFTVLSKLTDAHKNELGAPLYKALRVLVKYSGQYKKLQERMQKRSSNAAANKPKVTVELQPKQTPSVKDSKFKSMTADEIKFLASKQGPHSTELDAFLNSKSKGKTLRAGYWRQSPKSGKTGLPFPVVRKVKGYNKKSFLELLKKKTSRAPKRREKGTSMNRWTDESNGSITYGVRGKMEWPQGYVTYLKKGVPPSQSFYKFITGKENPNLPTYT